jgi:CHAD domain-containing protein
MPFAFDRSDTSLQAALRRLAKEQADDALAATSAEEPLPGRLHGMRLSVKRTRALLRLFAPGGFEDADRTDKALRDAARRLAPLRDSHVLEETLARLTEGDPAPALLAGDTPSGEATDSAEAVRAFAADMTRLRRRAAGWKLHGADDELLRGGLALTVKLARKRYRDARKDTSPEAVHALRKLVKDHFYHAKLVTPVWPELIAPYAEAANRLGDLLGLHHDLEVLVDRLEAPRRKEAKALLARARTRQAELWDEADALGARLFAEKPSALADRWVALWQVWRGQS